MASTVFSGQKILIECVFRLNGVPTDPTIVNLTSRSPAGVQTILAYPNENFTRRSAGVFEASVLVNEAGTWVFRAEGQGVVDALNEFDQNVVQSGLSG